MTTFHTALLIQVWSQHSLGPSIYLTPFLVHIVYKDNVLTTNRWLKKLYSSYSSPLAHSPVSVVSAKQPAGARPVPPKIGR